MQSEKIMQISLKQSSTMLIAPATIPNLQQEHEIIHVIAWIEFYPGLQVGGVVEEIELDFANNGKPIGPRLREWVKKTHGDTARVEHWEAVQSIQDLRDELEYEFCENWEF